MDPLTAWANAVAAIANLLTEIVRSAPDTIKMQVWAWWREDMERWRKFWKIDERMAARDAEAAKGVKRGLDEGRTSDHSSPAEAAGS